MKLTSILFVVSLFVASTTVIAKPIKTSESTIQKLKQFQLQDHFLPDKFLYTGVQDPELKKQLNQKVADTSLAFIKLYESKTPPTRQQLLQVLSEGINQIDPASVDSEDRQQVATVFENFLDIIKLNSSEGILNTWVYGEAINRMMEQGLIQPH